MPKVQGLINEAAPKDKKPLVNLTPHQIAKLKTVGDIILTTLLVAGTVALSVAAPNIFQVLGKVPWKHKTYTDKNTRYKTQSRKISKTFSYLKSKGYITLTPDGQDFLVKISQKGRKKILKFRFDALTIKPKGSWDGKWWLMMADIPNEYRTSADYLRGKTKNLGLFALQKSVWVYPFDPRDELNFLYAYYHLEPYVTFLRADVLDPEDEAKIKKHFQSKHII